MDGSGGDVVGTGPDVQSLTDIQSYLANFNKDLSPAQQGFTILTTGDNNVVGLTSADQLYAGDIGDANKLKLEDGLGEGLTVDNLGNVATSVQAPVFTIQQPGIANAAAAAAGKPNMIPAVQVMASVHDGTAIDSQQLMALHAATAGNQAQTFVAVGQPIVQAQPAPVAPVVQVAQAGQAAQVQLNTVQAQQPQAQMVTSVATSEDNQQAQVQVQMESKDDIQQQQSTSESQQPTEDTNSAVPAHTSSQDESVVVNTGNAYQTVTIVPSEVNQGGEVSYVLIVSQGDGEEKDGQAENVDMSVYDFKEEKGATEVDEDGTPKRVVKFTPKKQSVPMQTQLMCNYCNYTSPKRYLLTRHMKTHSEERPHKCHICDRGFKTMPSLQNHINTHTGVRPHKCKECDASFTTSGELVRHVRYRHTFEKPHKCPECDYASVELSKLKRHMRSHTGERPYQCPHCAYASPDTYKLKRHLRIHTGEKPYECDICHSRFTQSNSLKAHKLIHTGNKPIFQCELCPTTCGRRTDLKIHVQKLHTSDKPLQCKKCGKSFPDRYTYKIHTKTHEGEKCFKCELCPYSALSQRHLESHILTHTGEKPFRCDECDQSFRQKQLLKRHKNLYHTPDYIPPPPRDKIHECTECPKSFAHRGNLLRHLVTHDPDNVELQQAIEQHMLQQEADGVNEEEEEEEEDEMMEEGEMIATQGQLVGTGPDGVQLAEVNGQQVQVQLVSVGGEDGQQVYIQIGGTGLSSEQQQQAAAAAMAQMGLTQEQIEEATAAVVQQQQAAVTAEGTEAAEGMVVHEVEGGEIVKEEPSDSQSPGKRSRGVRRHLAHEMEAAATVQHLHAQEEEEEEPSAKRLRSSDDDSPRKLAEAIAAENDAVSQEDTEEQRRREEQKRKDIETCFGFDLDNDDSTT